MSAHKGKKKEQKVEQEQEQESYISSEDDDAALLTDKVQEKLLSTLARIKMKDPSIYNTKEPMYKDQDFEQNSDQEEQQKPVEKIKKGGKFTYKDMMGEEQKSQGQEQLAPVHQQRKAKESFKKALNKKIKQIQEEGDGDDLFTVKTKAKVEPSQELTDQKSKFKSLTKNYQKQSKKLIKKAWKSQQMDETDLFLKDYILDKKWLTSKFNQQATPQQAMIDQEDQERSQQMDIYQAQYNFRFEEPDGATITQYPRSVKDSVRQKPETRKEKRKKTEEKKKQDEIQIRKQAEAKKLQLKKTILQRLEPQEGEEEDHDWFFCDDCCKGFTEGEAIWECQECQDFMLCDSCNQLIIHKHPLKQGIVPDGCGAPKACTDVLQQLKSCKTCRRRITPTKKRYEYTDKAYLLNVLCQNCYDQSNLQTKKKYKPIDPESYNYQELLEQDPQKVKQLNTHKDIEQLVDEYIKNDFEDVISGGVKTKFRYISVQPEDYGLSDEQILFGDDKQLNKYVSVKKLAPYMEEKLRLRNSIYKKKVKTINKSVKNNKKMLEKGQAKLQKVKQLNRMRQRADAIKQRRQKKVRLLNLSSKQRERNIFVSSSRLMSYGIAQQPQQQ